MNIAVFGGAFNPVHNGHLHLVKELMRVNTASQPFDKLILVPTANPPHKLSDGLIDGAHRINMLNLAFEGNDNIEISTIEFESKDKSYTYNTLKKLREIYPNDNLILLIGTDQLFNFKSWYKYKKIFELADVQAITRFDNERKAVFDYLNDNKGDAVSNISVCVAPAVVVSSTDIREKVKNGEAISDLVPKKVEEYIKEHRLYV